MIRRSSPVRPDLATRTADLGFEFAVGEDDSLYWDETIRYEFSLRQIEDDLEDPTTELWSLCQKLAGRAAHDQSILERLGIPRRLHWAVGNSFDHNAPSLYGRFDLAYDGDGPAKLLEFNADTPTSIYEAAVFQWHWLEDLKVSGALPSHADQFNSLHEALIAQWQGMMPNGGMIHFACMDNVEDRTTIEYLADCALQAGCDVECMRIAEIGLRHSRLVDLNDEIIGTLFKLYPWEWLIADAWGRSPALSQLTIIEPIWKMMLSTKAILVELWRMFPDHPNLLPAYYTDEEPRWMKQTDRVIKPLHSREGAGVCIISQGDAHIGAKLVSDSRYVTQSFARNLFRTETGHAVIGSWLVGGKACGIGLREDEGLITRNTSRFVPHVIL
ncbi:glutathionylspermidine synthase family protein [Rhizobium oryzicola]|uniref:Glutathionylspermidine synthase family protein n=1 Tax=Rhizobium oryzicola TaxID=1232668 RepID=A0ABT8SS87_9HYPH|nr:glutathionylspermidine synthase family protein [Rhizobium oryzicola]MDO1580939.1 glutathionylspermidine synthase family protein [Rhizobium oryzicola]